MFSNRHPVLTEPPSHKLSGVWVRSKRTGAVGFISFVVKYRPYMDTPAEVYVVFPPSPHNKRIANVKTFSGGVYRTGDLVRLNRKRRKT